jgi:hypothetical protein
VDWTAAQFGHEQFPLVQRHTGSGWQRLTVHAEAA